MGIRVYEPAVAITDLTIGIEAGIFAIALMRTVADDGAGSLHGDESARWFIAFFAATSVAAIAGAALHGLVPDRDVLTRRRLWRVSLGSIGVAALSAWCLGAILALPREAAHRVRGAATAVHVAYLVWLARTNPPYAVAIAVYLPGALALGAGLARRLRDPATAGAATTALAGLGLTFGAALVQVRKIALHRRLFDHNATYHTIEAIAIGCFYAAARGLIQPGGLREHRTREGATSDER